MRFRIGIILSIVFCLISVYVDEAYSQEEEWNVLPARYCTIFCEKEVDLKSINRRVNLGFANFYSPRNYRKKGDLSIKEILTEKFDAIFCRVQDVLDMYPSKVQVAINIYKDKEGLDRVYEEIFNEPNEAVSFYIYKTNTIYTTERAINENIIAHEMAHCIIDHYFVILPPRKIQEILAVYADVHLKD
ncbi:MAG: hypothetical protein KJ957_03405 [Candidatus Omnitrophica bacterium]|nr:hypothetical protein [Candidatus Omnitrophota bacterium]MBU1853075.1 hypothetical protein [Candidatus Omnitrophota bacterium]